MNIFEEYLLEELKEEFERTDLSEEEYAELKERFEELSHLDEAQPYLTKLRGTSYAEYRASDTEDGPADTPAPAPEKTAPPVSKKPQRQSEPADAPAQKEDPYESFVMTSIEINDNWHMIYHEFPMDTEWIQAKCCYKGLKKPRSVRVEVVIYEEAYEKYKADTLRFKVGNDTFYADPKPCTEKYAFDFNLSTGDGWFKTASIKSKNNYRYPSGNYIVVISFEGKTYWKTFSIYNGYQQRKSVRLDKIQLFANGEDARVNKNPRTSFPLEGLHFISFKFYTEAFGGEDKYSVMVSYKLEYLETGATWWNRTYRYTPNTEIIAFWKSLGYREGNDQWERGLYRFTGSVAGGNEVSVTFSVI